jgi:Caspase domain
MLSRRSLLGGVAASLPLVAMPGRVRAHAMRPQLHALIVGINTYAGRDARGPIRPLRGCLNDADDIEQQVHRLRPVYVRRLGWDPVKKQELPVTRAGFFEAWHAMLAEARAGDTLLFTYSGHGSQVPVLPGNPTGEADGMDETLVLTGYNVSDGRNGELIIDDELDGLFRAAHARGLIVVFVSDSCHSGTAYRKVEWHGVSYRTLDPDPLARRRPVAAPRPVAPPAAPPNLLFLAGAQDDELVPEISIEGRYRGALSVAVARALEGRAATDGIVTAYGLARFVLGHVRDLSDGGQHPHVMLPTPAIMATSTQAFPAARARATPASVLGVSRDTPVIVLAGASPSPVVPAVQVGLVRLRILGLAAAEQQRIVRSLTGAMLVGDDEPVSLIWDVRQKLVLNDQGHRLAENVEASGLQHAIDRRLALDRLGSLRVAGGSGLDMKILLGDRETPASDATHKPGARLSVVLSGIDDGHYYALFNLAGNGQVEMLEPYPAAPSSLVHPSFKTGMCKAKGGQQIDIGGVSVKAEGPFGAEHVVAVAGALPLGRLMPALAKAHNEIAVSTAMAGLLQEAEVQPLQVGFRGIYSARD